MGRPVGQHLATGIAVLLLLRAAILPAKTVRPLPIRKPPVDDVLIFPGPSHPRGAKPQITTFPLSLGNVAYYGTAAPGDKEDQRILRIHRSWARSTGEMDHGPFLSPVAEVGMIIPVCGRVGKIIGVDNDVRVQLLPDAKLPEGVALPGEAPALMLGGKRGHPQHGLLELARIGTNAAGKPSVDLKQRWPGSYLSAFPDQKSGQRDLTVGSRFTLEEVDWQADYEIASIIPPDKKQHIVGWITLKADVGTFHWREHRLKLSPLPKSITVPWVPQKDGESQNASLPSFRSDIKCYGAVVLSADQEPSHLRLLLDQETHPHVSESWEYRTPPCRQDLLLPLCGQVGRIESSGHGTVFKMLAESDLPPGVSFPSDNLPVILGAPGNLRLERIGLDDTGALSADITQEWKPSNLKDADRKSESLTGLKIGSTFTRKYSWGTCDYRVMQIIAPDPKHHVPGWIGVRPVPGTRHGAAD